MENKIEIDIYANNQKQGENKFIDIENQNMNYFHIFFDENIQESKKTSISFNENIKNIKILVDYEVKSFKDLFRNCECITTIFIKGFNLDYINDTSSMFYGCKSLKGLYFEEFNTNKVTDMSHMFHSCSSLQRVDLTKFNTGNVSNMSHMFEDCSSLKSLDLSNFGTKM